MKTPFSWRSFWRGAGGLVFMLVVWEVFARSGLFSEALTPPLIRIAKTAWQMMLDGRMEKNAAFTLGRVLLGLFFACLIGIPIGMLMGRLPRVERFLLPLLSVLMPIPSLAWVPLFVLWFGIGELTTFLVVVYAAAFPVVFNVWTGVRAVNPLWTRAAFSMGANQRQLFRKVVLPGASPYVITAIRLAFGRAWIAVIGGELLASPAWGLGRVIFDAKEFLNSEVMMASLIAIGVIGLVFERVVFQALERHTVARWGMISATRR
ncbi:MAG TPA: ABC transporter permease [Burkholderiales bacterium]|nr:ABC transporter permease [Burkholderiales bacterium]